MHLQGSLDGLCGAYAVINSLTLMAPDLNAEMLFSCLIGHMGQRLAAAMLEGMSTAELRKLVLAPCVGLCDTRNLILRYRACRCESLAEYWQTVQAHTAQHGSGSVVLGIAGGYEHWTCVQRVTDKTMLLADSSTLTRLYRRHVSVDTTAAKYHLSGKDTFLMTIKRK